MAAMVQVPFLWPLLPPFLERPSVVASVATASKGLGQALREDGRLRLGHLVLHPNTLGSAEVWQQGLWSCRNGAATVSTSSSVVRTAPRAETTTPPVIMAVGSTSAITTGSPRTVAAAAQASDSLPRRGSCLQRVSFSALVSVQFHIPRLKEALNLIQILCSSSCCCLRKVVDRQSRWRPREQRYESLSADCLELAASLADALGTALPSLRHVEGQIFPVLLRARAARVTASAGKNQSTGGGRALTAAAGDVSEDGSAETFAVAGDRVVPANERLGRSLSGGFQGAPVEVEDEPRGLGGRAEVLHLIDVTPVDLLGLWEPLCPRLQKLVLLNLPASAPGLSATAIASFLPKAPALTELQLDFQFFDPGSWDLEALEELVRCVQVVPSKINKLVLDWCRLGDAGVTTVCRTLAQHPRTEPGSCGVTELSLAHCELRDISSVCEMLETPGLALTKLDLSSNALEDSQALLLARSLPHSLVKELRLRDSQISIPLPVKVDWFWGCV